MGTALLALGAVHQPELDVVADSASRQAREGGELLEGEGGWGGLG